MSSAWLLPEHIADVLPAQARRIEELRRSLLDLARSYGFELVMPPLLEYLESPAFRQNKPQVLVWQMFEPTYAQGPDARGLWDNASLMSADAWRARMKAALGK